MDYRYRSPVGMFRIHKVNDMHFDLYIDDILIGTYISAEKAVQDVLTQSTGWEEWDRQPGIDKPELDRWEKIPEGEAGP